MADSAIKYKSQGYLNESISVKISVTEFRRMDLNFYLLKKIQI